MEKDLKIKITEDVFRKAKRLLEAGWTQMETAETLGISKTSVYSINQSKEYKDYKTEINKKNREKKPAVVESVNTKELYFQQQILGMIRCQNQMMTDMKKTMELISNKITDLVDQLT